jgi:hypothetical protein
MLILSGALVAAATMPVAMTLAPALQAYAIALLPEPSAPEAGEPPRIIVLTPAHDEAAGIMELVRHVREALGPRDRHVVIADNCTDETEQLASRGGADVVVRYDPGRRGKGYALAAGLRTIANDPADVVVFLDADCRLDQGSLQILANTAHQLQRPVQCLDLMQGGTRSGLAEFAWLLRNELRPSGYARLGLPCQLLGTGMALPKRLATQRISWLACAAPWTECRQCSSRMPSSSAPFQRPDRASRTRRGAGCTATSRRSASSPCQLSGKGWHGATECCSLWRLMS